jgi:cardiolipin synthase A/B
MVISANARQTCALLLTAALGAAIGLSSCKLLSPVPQDAALEMSERARVASAKHPLTSGNEVVLQDSATTREAMLDAIERAHDHIHLLTYRLEDDRMGERLADALIRQSQRGLAVHVICDGVGSSGTSRALLLRFSQAGVKVLAFNPVDIAGAEAGGDRETGGRSHRKLLIVDGHTAFSGGISISSLSSGGSFSQASHTRPGADHAGRDTDLQVRGPAVAEFQRIFMTTWGLHGGPPFPPRSYFPELHAVGNDMVRAIGSGPQEGPSVIYLTLLAAIASADTRIRLTNTHFVPDPVLVDALEDAADRGVDVALVLPGRGDSWLVLSAGRAQYERLLRAGVKIHERRGEVRHSKTVLIDGEWAVVGSTNLDWRSSLQNHELDTVVMGAGFGARLATLFDHDLANADEIRLEAWDRRPAHQRMREALALAWAYWL